MVETIPVTYKCWGCGSSVVRKEKTDIPIPSKVAWNVCPSCRQAVGPNGPTENLNAFKNLPCQQAASSTYQNGNLGQGKFVSIDTNFRRGTAVPLDDGIADNRRCKRLKNDEAKKLPFLTI